MTLDRDLDGDVLLLWPTPIFRRLWPDTASLNRRLTEIILEKEAEDAGVTVSNAGGGWQSKPDLMMWPYPEVTRLGEWIGEAIMRLIRVTTDLSEADFTTSVNISAWANINRRGGFNRAHTHPGCHWSGVYYVTVGDQGAKAGDSGRIEFWDPRTAVEMLPMPRNPFGRPKLFEPRPGTMLVFPSWLRHSVLPFAGEDERITIAFNVRLDDFQTAT